MVNGYLIYANGKRVSGVTKYIRIVGTGCVLWLVDFKHP
jgi:hypothetical protein